MPAEPLRIVAWTDATVPPATTAATTATTATTATVTTAAAVTAETSAEPVTAGALAVVAARARRRAVRAGDPEVDTGHLLHALLETDESALGVAAPLPVQATRLMGYLVQRSIGFGRLWRFGEGVSDRERERSAGLAWSASAAGALRRASRDGGGSVLDLLRELATVADCRAAEILRGAAIDPAAVVQRCVTAQRAERADRR